MRKVLNLALAFVIGAMSVALMSVPSYAQEEAPDTVIDDSYDYNWDDDFDWDYDWDYSYDDTYTADDVSAELATALGGLGILFGGIALVFSLTVSLALYVYSALTLMAIANKLEAENAWFAWIPILNIVLLYKLGDQNPLLLLLLLVPGIGALVVTVFSVIALMNICEKRGYDKMLGLLSLIPLANLVLMGVLAWGKKS